MKITKEILQISNPSFRNIPPTAVEDTARRITRVSKSSRFTRSRTPTRPPPPPPKKTTKKTTKRSTRFTKKTTPPPKPRPVRTPLPPPAKPKTTSIRTPTRGSVRFTRTPTKPTKPKTTKTIVRTPPKPKPKPTPPRSTRFTPRPPPPPPVVRAPPPKPTPKPDPKPIVTPSQKSPTKRPRPSTAKPIAVQQPTTVINTVVEEKLPGKVETVKQEIVQTPTAVVETESARERALRIREEKAQERAKIPFIPGVPGLIGGAIPLAAGEIPFQETTKKTVGEEAFKLEGFKGAGEGFLGSAGAAKGRQEALDLSEKVLSEETVVLPSDQVTEVIPGGEPTTEVREFIDPETGLPTTETKTTIPGDIEIVTEKGGETVKQTIGQSEVTPDFSDPIGSLVGGASQSALNEVIALKNLPGAVTGGEQEEFFVTPSSIFFDSTFQAINKLGGEIFDLGRQAAGKERVEAGQSITTFGIAGDEVRIDQQERGPSSREILETGSQRITRVATADPLFAVGDLAVQTGLLVIAPVRAASVAIRGIGAAGKFAKVATKGVGAIKGRGLQSATGKAVTQPKPKTPLSTTFAEEFEAAGKIERAQLPEKAQLKSFGALSKTEKQKLTKSQREQFEKALDEAQRKEAPAGARGFKPGEETAEFVQRRRDAAEFAKLQKERIGASQIDPSLQKAIDDLERGGDPDLFKVKETGFTSTPVDLGKGIGKFLDEGGDLGGIGKGPPPAGFTGTGVDLGTSVVKTTTKVTKAKIDKVKKAANLADDADAEKAIREASDKGVDITTSGNLALIRKAATKQTTALKELEEARKVLKKTKSTQKTVSSVADQKTQRRLSQLIKNEKIKKAELPSNKATVIALRKLINAEKAKIGSKAVSKTDDLLFAKPKPKPKGRARVVEEPPQVIRTPKVKPGVLGGIATGVAIGAGVGIGLNQDQLNKPKVIENPNIFNKEISRVVNDPTVQITRTVQQPKETTIQRPGIVNIFREEQQPRTAITTIFDQDQTTKQKTDKTFTTTKQTKQPIQEIITTTTPPGLPPGRPGGGFPFDGSRSDEAKESKSQRRFFRLFDVAKTPFGRIEVGLGAQVQSDKPIFEFEDVPTRSGKKRRNIAEDFFSEDFAESFV